MQNDEQIKEMVKQKYSEIALQDKETNQSSCCGAGGCSTEVYNIMSDDYTEMSGYEKDADLGLGCGLPTQFAKIKKGDTVIDLGSGAGNDCFIARAETGAEGKVIGIDFTPAMIDKARANAEKAGFQNVEFRQGDIEKMPVTANTADVVVSNCVLNLVPNKNEVFKDIFRVLKPGGQLIVLECTKPSAPVIKQLYYFYMKYITPKIGKLIAKNNDAYQYLNESILEFPEKQAFIKILNQSNYRNAFYKTLTLETCTIYSGEK